MSEELDELLDLEPRRGVASVAPIAFFIGTSMGGILAVFGTLYALSAVGGPVATSVQPETPAAEAADPPASEGFLSSLFRGGGSTRIPADRRRPSVASEPLPITDTAAPTVAEAPGTAAATEGATIAAIDASRGVAPATAPIDPTRGESALLRDLERIRAQLQQAEAKLAAANTEQVRLRQEIAALKKDLNVTERLLENAREDAIYNRWVAFLEGAKNRICGQYGRTRSDRCRAAVKASLLTPAQRERFAYCLRSGQFEPYVERLERGALPPTQGRMLDETNRSTRDWMVVFCDDTLPIDPDGPLADRSGVTSP